MINILYEPFPESIIVNNEEYEVITDFRDWIRFSDLIVDDELDKAEKLELMLQWIVNPPSVITDDIVDALSDFCAASELEYCRSGDNNAEADNNHRNKPPVFSWKIDARYVLADFRRFYNINLLGIGYMHWWEFRSLFSGLPDDSTCHKRMMYRSADLSEIKSKTEQERIHKIQQQIALPFECSDDAIAAAFGGMI